MKTLGEAAVLAARHRRFVWCRRENDFCDMPIWRVVARKLKLPLSVIVAFVNRLEELANKTEPRGYVGDFSAAEFAAALDISGEDAARIFVELEDAAIGWIAQDHVATFYRRNPDREDASAAVRQQRVRDRKKALKEIARAFALGRITEQERRQRELAVLGLPPLSTAIVTRDSVTVTPEQSRASKEAGNSGDSQPQPTIPALTGGKADAAEEVDATTWLQFHGKRIVIERLDAPATLADTRMMRWLDDLGGNAVALGEIILAADKENYIAARFHNLVTDQIRRHRNRAEPSLPLPPASLKLDRRSG